jgi:hypothetical protein
MLARMQQACVTYAELPGSPNRTSEQPLWRWPALQALLEPATPPPLSLPPTGLEGTESGGCLVLSLSKAIEYTQPELHAALINR